jgi:hypothetical protein
MPRAGSRWAELARGALLSLLAPLAVLVTAAVVAAGPAYGSSAAAAGLHPATIYGYDQSVPNTQMVLTGLSPVSGRARPPIPNAARVPANTRLAGFLAAEEGTALADPAATRVGLRVGTKQAIQDAAPKTADGDFIDPNTGQVIPKDGPFDYGHKPGYTP